MDVTYFECVSHTSTALDAVYELHRDTATLYTGGQDISTELKFIYRAMRTPSGSALLIRAPNSFPSSSESTKSFAVGQRFRFILKIPMVQQAPSHDESGAKQKRSFRAVPRSDIESFIAKKMLNQGYNVDKCEIVQLYKEHVKKRGSSFSNHVGVVELAVTVVDPAKAAHAFVNGVGRNRRFGYGMLVDV